MQTSTKEERTRIISTLVENRPGVLHKVSNMFRARSFNIDSLTVGPTEQSDVSRMTIAVTAPDPVVDQLAKQLRKLVDVIDVTVLEEGFTVHRELALVKLEVADPRVRTDIISYVNIFRSRVVDVSPNTMTVEVTGAPDKIDAFLDIASTFGIKMMARTGVTALPRG